MKKVLIRLIIILIILSLLSIMGLIGYNYYIDLKNKELKDKFYMYIGKNNLDTVFDYSLEKKMISKIQNEEYTSKTKIEFDNTLKFDSRFEINKFTLNLNSYSDNINKKSSIKFNYSNNELFNIDILSNLKYLAIKNTDVLNNYIGIEKENLNKSIDKIDSNLKNTCENLNELRKHIILKENEEEQNFNNSYLNTIKENIKSNEYYDEGDIIIEQNGEKINTHAYSLTIDKNEFMRIYSIVTDAIENDDKIINSIISSDPSSLTQSAKFESKLNFQDIIFSEEQEIHSLRGEENLNNNQSQENNFSTDSITNSQFLSKLVDISKNLNDKINDYKSYEKYYNGCKYLFCISNGIRTVEDAETVKSNLNDFFQEISEILDEKIKDNDNIKITVYVSDDNTLKIHFIFGKNLELDINYINQTATKNMLGITISEKIGDKYDGYTLTFSKNKTTAIDNNSIEVAIIKDSKIVNKIEVKLNIEGSINSNKFTNNISLLYSGEDGKFNSIISNDLSFGNTEVESINENNTLLLDSLSDNDFYYTINKLNSRLDDVYEDKVSKLNLINTNTSDTIVNNNEPEEIIEENEDEKNKIIDILIDAISKEMGIAINEGREYTLKDLKDLTIEGYNIQVSVSEEIAIIKINNYTFKIDKEFHLSE